jgi:iron(III) transport system ATP-binding protein
MNQGLAGQAGYLLISNVSKRFGAFRALEDVSFSAGKGEFVSVLGPSGCGKTTLLRIVAGLERQDQGAIHIGSNDVSALPTSRRNVGIVFQSYALFPNLTAAENVAYGLKINTKNRAAIDRRVSELMSLVGLEGFGGKYPAQLSGGQQQRVALARAMALSPDILLLDEPLSALDAQVRVHLRGEIMDLQRNLNVTAIMVTHDQEEALTMADRILVMDKGRIVQQGTPREIYDCPTNPFVAAFIGYMNFLGSARKIGRGVYELGGLKVEALREPQPVSDGGRAVLAIRPEDLVLKRGAGNGQPTFQGRVQHVEFRGASVRVALQLRGINSAESVFVDMPALRAGELGLESGAIFSVGFPAHRMNAYPAS